MISVRVSARSSVVQTNVPPANALYPVIKLFTYHATTESRKNRGTKDWRPKDWLVPPLVGSAFGWLVPPLVDSTF